MSSQEVDLNQNRQAEIIIVAWVFTGLAIAAVGLKLFARVQVVKVVGWDDFFIFLALACSIIAASFVTYSVPLGLGRHTAAVEAEYGPERLVLTAKWQILGYPFNILSFSLPNISIAILVNRLLDPNVPRSRLIFGLAVLQVILAAISIFIVFLMCSPTRKLWNASASGSCLSSDVLNDFSYFLSAYTTLTDIVLAIIPIVVFRNLRIRFLTKCGVCIMMGLTLLSAIVTIVKATYLYLFTDHNDPLYNVVPLVLWGLIEQNVVIIAACVPTIRPIFHSAFKGNRSKSGSNSGSVFKLTSKATRAARQQSSTESEIPLGENREQNYAELTPKQEGIWRTVDVSVELDEERSIGVKSAT